MGIWCRIEVKHVSDMFWSLGYDKWPSSLTTSLTTCCSPQNQKLSKYLQSLIWWLYRLTFEMLKVDSKPKILSTGHSILVIILWLFEILIWIPAFHYARTAGNRDTQHSHVMFKVQSVSNVMDHTRANIITNLHGATKQISRPIYLGSKQNKRNCVLICWNILIIKGIIKWISISAHSGSITSIENNMLQNTRKLGTIRSNKST